MKIPTRQISFEKTFQGAWRLTWVSDSGSYYTQQYFGYTKRDALAEFKAYVRQREAA